MKNTYSEEILKLLFTESCEDLKKIGISTDVPMSVKVNYRTQRRFGVCRHDLRKNTFDLDISAFILTPEIIKEYRNKVKSTIIHEILHAVADHTSGSRNNHRGQWARLAEYVNRMYPEYKISRLSSMSEFGLDDRININFKYLIKCPECGSEWRRMRMSNLVRHTDLYRCSRCRGKLIRLK